MDERMEVRVERRGREDGGGGGGGVQDFALAGRLRLAAICRNGPGFRKPWRSGIKACVEFLYPIVHVWFRGSRVALR